MRTVGRWIFKRNLESFLEILAYVAGCPFEDWDYCAVVAGVEDTNDETNKWFDYQLTGSKRLVSFQVADDPGSSVLHFRIDVPEDAIEMIELAFYVAESNDLTRHSSYGK